MGPHGQYRIEQQDALFGPPVEVAGRRNGRTDVGRYLLKDVLQRRGKGNTVVHRKTESVGLPLAVIGVLADDDHFEFLERALVEGAEDVAAARIDALCGVFVANEVDELREVGFFEFGSQQFLPVGGYFHVHSRSNFS